MQVTRRRYYTNAYSCYPKNRARSFGTKAPIRRVRNLLSPDGENKKQLTNRLNARAHSTLEYRHGPHETGGRMLYFVGKARDKKPG